MNKWIVGVYGLFRKSSYLPSISLLLQSCTHCKIYSPWNRRDVYSQESAIVMFLSMLLIVAATTERLLRTFHSRNIIRVRKSVHSFLFLYSMETCMDHLYSSLHSLHVHPFPTHSHPFSFPSFLSFFPSTDHHNSHCIHRISSLT